MLVQLKTKAQRFDRMWASTNVVPEMDKKQFEALLRWLEYIASILLFLGNTLHA